MAQTKQTPQKSRADAGNWFSRLSPFRKDLVLIALLYVILLVLFNEIIFKDMIFAEGSDTAASEAWNQAMKHISDVEHVEPLWIPYIFSGMPLFGALVMPRQVDYLFSGILLPVARIIFFNAQMHWMIFPFLLMGAGMYFVVRHLKFSHGPAFLAAVTMMLNPYAIGLPETGHGTKLIVLSIIPWLLFSTMKLFEKKNLLWTGILALVTGTLLLNRHPQIAFYGLLVIGLYVLYQIVITVRKEPGALALKLVLFVVAMGVGFAMFAYQYFPVNEYAQYSIRGSGGSGASAGLDYQYATNWSFHPAEMMNYFIPSFFGLWFMGDKVDVYWGWMPFTNSIVYLGIIPLFLGIVAFARKRTGFVWFLLCLMAIMLFMAFGKHLSVLFDLMFNYMPHFKQFRTPVMVLHLMPMIFGILAAFGLTYYSDLMTNGKEPDLVQVRKRLMYILYGIGGLLVIGFILNSAVEGFLSGFMFRGENDAAELRRFGVAPAQYQQALPQLKQLRFDTLWKGFVYVAVFSGAGIGLLVGGLRRKVTLTVVTVGLIALTAIDLWIIDQKYINPQPGNAVAQHFQADATIEGLKAESDTSLFRVFPAGDLDQDNTMMYHHIQSVEGYSPAKLKIYQEVRDSCFAKGNRNVFDMLNVKYLVMRQQAADGSAQTVAQMNPGALPRAWFVDSVVQARSKAEAFAVLNSPAWNPRTTAVLEGDIPAGIGRADSATAKVTAYSSREITLSAETPRQALLILSEIYYPAGWKATVDDKETEIYQANHILRGVVVPAGSHTIRFRFDPGTYESSYKITNIAWGIAGVLVLAGIVQLPVVRRRFAKKESAPAA